MSKETVYWTFGVLGGVCVASLPSAWSWLATIAAAFVLGSGSVFVAEQISKLRRE